MRQGKRVLEYLAAVAETFDDKKEQAQAEAAIAGLRTLSLGKAAVTFCALRRIGVAALDARVRDTWVAKRHAEPDLNVFVKSLIDPSAKLPRRSGRPLLSGLTGVSPAPTLADAVVYHARGNFCLSDQEHVAATLGLATLYELMGRYRESGESLPVLTNALRQEADELPPLAA